jgi:hypothetical protein
MELITEKRISPILFLTHQIKNFDFEADTWFTDASFF